MDPPQDGFDALERALGQATFTFEHDGRVSDSSKHATTHAPRSPPTVPSAADPESPLVSPLSNDDYDSFDVSITPPPDHHPELIRHNSGLPPTPPTMTNSDVAEAKIDRSMSPLPLFADRVRNALESQKSGISTPIVENHSPPTPDPSPHAMLPTLMVPRPELIHQLSSQSQAESFETATEGHSIHNSTGQAELPSESNEQEEHRFLRTPKPTRATSVESRGGLDALGLSDQSDRGEARMKTYHIESDTDGERVRTKNYQTESDSDMEKSNTARPISDGHSTADESPTSPTMRKTLDHRAAYQRLRKPIQPGDAVKRPDAALLYGSLGPRKLPNGLDRGKAQPKREMDTEFLRNANELAPSKTPELMQAASLQPEPVLEPVPDADAPQALQMPDETPLKLREFAPSEAPPDPTPPTTAQKASLDENNIVYRMIQEENAKRHSAISDGSVPAVVIPVQDHKRKLRHMQKRESLRGDVSMEGNSKRSSSESGHKLKHMKAALGDGEVDSGVAPGFPYSKSLSLKKPAAKAQPGGETYLDAALSSPPHKRQSQRKKVSVTEAERSTTPDAGHVQLSARISRFAPGENGFDYWSSIPDPQMPNAAAPTTELSFKPRRLRRSLREHGLDRNSSVADSSEGRPLSMDGSNPQQAPPLPKLKRSSQDKSLDKNNEVRRTSLGRETQTASQHIDTKLDLVAEDLTREGREMRDRMSISTKERHASTDRSFHSATSPRRKSFDPRHLHPIGTPYSASQFSDRTEAELLEARGVEIFPHNNESLLVIQQASQAISRPLPVDIPPVKYKETDEHTRAQAPVFEAYIQEPLEDGDQTEKPTYTIDSPLTNPRAAPEPPVIKFIPPTPNEELERSLEQPGDAARDPRKTLQRNLSLSQRVRRYSESLIQPLPFGRNGSVRKQEPKRVVTMPEPRPTYLSSFWQPRDFWEEYDSEEDSDGYEPLPPGGDTSNVEDKRRMFLPRNMSVRMPGFRGTGGFLVGNSLGLDRHGTNNRRHYVTKRSSEEVMRRIAEKKRRRTFTLPFSGGTKVEYVGLAGLGAWMRKTKQRRQTRALEKRRERLRGQIGNRLYQSA